MLRRTIATLAAALVLGSLCSPVGPAGAQPPQPVKASRTMPLPVADLTFYDVEVKSVVPVDLQATSPDGRTVQFGIPNITIQGNTKTYYSRATLSSGDKPANVGTWTLKI